MGSKVKESPGRKGQSALHLSHSVHRQQALGQGVAPPLQGRRQAIQQQFHCSKNTAPDRAWQAHDDRRGSGGLRGAEATFPRAAPRQALP